MSNREQSVVACEEVKLSPAFRPLVAAGRDETERWVLWAPRLLRRAVVPKKGQSVARVFLACSQTTIGHALDWAIKKSDRRDTLLSQASTQNPNPASQPRAERAQHGVLRPRHQPPDPIHRPPPRAVQRSGVGVPEDDGAAAVGGGVRARAVRRACTTPPHTPQERSWEARQTKPQEAPFS